MDIYFDISRETLNLIVFGLGVCVFAYALYTKLTNKESKKA